jgi:hypothetical protein
MKTLLTGAAVSALLLNPLGMAYAAEAGDLPPNAVPGHCYGKMLVPEQYENYSEQVLENSARTELKIIQAVTGETEQRVVATEAYTQYETIPATYRTVTETVVIRAAGVRRETIPGVMGTETEQVLVRAAHTVWKRGTPGPHDVVVPGSQSVIATGEVICLVEIPAEYRTVTRTVVKQAETTRDIPVAAETTTVTRQVVDQPARVIEHQIPATYKSIRVATIVQPERTETIQIPATYRTITKQKIVSQSHFEWREVSCQPEGGPPSSAGLGYGVSPVPLPPAPPVVRRTPSSYSSSTITTTTTSSSSSSLTVAGGDTTVRSMQVALHEKGYYNGPINGLFSVATQDSMTRYQRDTHLAVGRFTPETARALGISR